jgi:putative ABC transport system permease protein
MNLLAPLAVLFVIVLGVIGLLALRRRMLATMAVRNITRRKTYSGIVVAGLMIATAMIAASLVVGDTLDFVIKKDTFDSTGNTDIIVSVPDASGMFTYFNQSIGYDTIASVKAGSLPEVDMASPAIRDSVTIMDPRTNLPFPGALLFAFDPQNAANPLVDEQHQQVTSADFAPGDIVINRALADEIDAVPGDALLVFTREGVNASLTVSKIAADQGMGDWQNQKIVFLELTSAQMVLNESGRINVIDISCKGGIRDGYKVTDRAVQELNASLPSALGFDFDNVKKDGVESAQAASDSISQIFVIMSSFAIIAGVALITNIFVMLAEERKPEMGISRAIGMQRGDLTQSFMFEGAIYALMASLVGAAVGLLIADVMIRLFESLFAGEGIALAFHFNWDSIVVAAFAGFLLTMITVVAASWRVSNLNIVRAIRDIPEPTTIKTGHRYALLATMAIVLGVLLTVVGDATRQIWPVVSGPCLIALGGALLGSRYTTTPRIPFTLASAFMVFWELSPFHVLDVFGPLNGGMEMFIVSGVVLVSGGVIFVMFNSDILLMGLVRIFGKKNSTLPVLKVSISYPLNKKFRTGLSLFIFALIMFTVIVISMISSFERESVSTTTQNFSGGFQVIGSSFRGIDQANLTAHLDHLNQTDNHTYQGAIQRVEIARSASIDLIPWGTNSSSRYSIVGFSDTMLRDHRFSLSKRSPEFATDQEAWSALIGPNSSYAIMDGSVIQAMYGPSTGGALSMDVGQKVTVVSNTGTEQNLTVIGIMNQFLLTGVFTSAEHVATFALDSEPNIFYFEASPQMQHSDAELAKALESEFVQYGLITYSITDVVKTYLAMVSSIMRLLEVFLAVGLIVGITGLGIITIRNVAERRQEIGVMRAIGYQRRMVLDTFLLETSFVSLLGIVLGVVMGLALSRQLYNWGDFSKSAPFVIPWFDILAIVGVAFVVTLISTLPPSRRASKLAPAEALRRVD